MSHCKTGASSLFGHHFTAEEQRKIQTASSTGGGLRTEKWMPSRSIKANTSCKCISGCLGSPTRMLPALKNLPQTFVPCGNSMV